MIPEAGQQAQAPGSPAVSVWPTPTRSPARIPVLTQRADFVRASTALRQGVHSLHLQARNRGDDGPMRVGFTCSKKVGNAVARNRAKRRLREIARIVLPQLGKPGWDYVLVGRAEVTGSIAFADLVADLERALRKIHP